MAIIDAAGVPVAPINMLADVVNDDHIANAREMFVHLQHPVIGDMIVPGNPVKLMDTKPEITKCAPDLGQDNKEIYEGVLGLSLIHISLRSAHSSRWRWSWFCVYGRRRMSMFEVSASTMRLNASRNDGRSILSPESGK